VFSVGESMDRRHRDGGRCAEYLEIFMYSGSHLKAISCPDRTFSHVTYTSRYKSNKVDKQKMEES
jgi:hypothetical protein